MLLFQVLAESFVIYWVSSIVLCIRNDATIIPPTKVLLNVLFNQLVVTPVIVLALPTTYLVDEEYLTWKSLLIYLNLYYVIQCMWFYWTHRLLHTRYFWCRVHYVHHTYTETFPYCAIYAHPFEHAVGNVASVIMGPIMFPYNINMFRIWIAMATVNSVYSHSYISRIGNPGNHDLHHLFFRYNYGTGTWVDKLFGTYMKPAPL